MAVVVGFIGCAHKSVSLKTAPPIDDSYVDLAAGGRLRIVVPLLKSGALGYKQTLTQLPNSGSTIVLSAGDLIGYEVSTFLIEGHGKGKVRLKFASAEVTENGKTARESALPKLPFALPSKSEHIRLIYLIRSSGSDHNMAVAAAKTIDELNVFTRKLKGDPAVCDQSGTAVFCSWVPAGVAVRPENGVFQE